MAECKLYLIGVGDEEWAFVALYLILYPLDFGCLMLPSFQMA